MRLDVLGSSGTYPGPGTPTSGYLVSDDGTNIWCDAGFGTYAELRRRIAVDRIDAVVISHAHPDHCADMLALAAEIAYGPNRTIIVDVHAPAALGDMLAEFVNAGDGHPIRERLRFIALGEGVSARIGEMELRFAGTAHSVPTHAIRFEARGSSLTYSADTGPGGGFPRLAAGSDVVLCEATLQGSRADAGYPFHLTAGEAGAIATEAGSRLLILTHLPPSLDPRRSIEEAAAGFTGEVRVASPGDVFDI